MRNPGIRQQLDHDRYMANHDERKAKQRAYYRAHREDILRRKIERGPDKFNTYQVRKKKEL